MPDTTTPEQHAVKPHDGRRKKILLSVIGVLVAIPVIAVIFILTYDAIAVRPDSCPRFVDRVAHFPNIQPERQLGTSMKK